MTNNRKEINFSKVKLKTAITCSIIALAFTGCAGTQEKERAMDRLSFQVMELKTSLDEANSRIDNLGNRFVLLQEKIEASKAEIERLSALPVMPPEGLKVVPLTEEHETRPEKAAQKAAVAKEPAAAPAPVKEPAATEEKLGAEAMYNKGQDLFMAARYEEARKAFYAMVRAYPRHALSDNALYWAGESYYSEKDFEKALEKFKEVADKYPDENKAPDALLKTGFSYMELNNPEKAKEALTRVISRYPGTDAALKAQKTLERDPGAKEGKR